MECSRTVNVLGLLEGLSDKYTILLCQSRRRKLGLRCVLLGLWEHSLEQLRLLSSLPTHRRFDPALPLVPALLTHRLPTLPEEGTDMPLRRSPSSESTESEREFRRRYQAVSHRMVHRKSSGHMFTHAEEKTFGKWPKTSPTTRQRR